MEEYVLEVKSLHKAVTADLSKMQVGREKKRVSIERRLDRVHTRTLCRETVRP